MFGVRFRLSTKYISRSQGIREGQQTMSNTDDILSVTSVHFCPLFFKAMVKANEFFWGKNVGLKLKPVVNISGHWWCDQNNSLDCVPLASYEGDNRDGDLKS